ncbi:unnamed protein product [Polarella glacialis]|uniref:Uncharacterized protein n=1 Tax=Polarella glacialis TaxID=89957 RepID=A0A813I4D1_POLGL|nr:unnamed protein product [Polarella glacialis]
MVLGLAFVGFLHEFTLLLPLACATLNFFLIGLLARLGRSAQALIPFVAWTLALGSLAASGSPEVKLARLLGGVGQWMDGFKGEVGWNTLFPLLVLKILSWGLDFHRSLHAVSKVDAPEAKIEPGPTLREERDSSNDNNTSRCPVSTLFEGRDSSLNKRSPVSILREEEDEERGRVEGHRSRQEYQSFGLYLAYLFYPPLYITGPIVTFNAFASYMEAPQQIVRGRSLMIYWARLFFNMCLFVMFGHYLYVSALVQNGPLKLQQEPGLIAFEAAFMRHEGGGEGLIWFSFWSLEFLWFKFLVIWRFSRAWALLDGVLAPEDMARCMCNNYSVRGFWRGWHRSFNRWNVRYIFVPLGGSKGVSVLQQQRQQRHNNNNNNNNHNNNSHNNKHNRNNHRNSRCLCCGTS